MRFLHRNSPLWNRVLIVRDSSSQGQLPGTIQSMSALAIKRHSMFKVNLAPGWIGVRFSYPCRFLSRSDSHKMRFSRESLNTRSLLQRQLGSGAPEMPCSSFDIERDQMSKNFVAPERVFHPYAVDTARSRFWCACSSQAGPMSSITPLRSICFRH